MQKQLNKINPVSILRTAYKPNNKLFTILLVLVSSISLWANPGKGAVNTGQPGNLPGTVTTDLSTLFFSAVQGQSSVAKQVKIIVSGVSSTAQTTIFAPDFYQIIGPGGTLIKNFTFAGNATVILFVRFSGSDDPGNFIDQLIISGAEINTKTVTLSTANSPNPSFFPSALNFSTVNDGQPSLPLELSVTVSTISPTAQTFLTAPDFYQFLSSPTATPGKTFTVTGSGLFKVFVRFSGSPTPGTFSGEITAEGDEIAVKTFPVKTIVLPKPTPVANPATLAGFTAVQNGNPSVIQSFDLSVKGLPVQGKPSLTVTAPKGYSVALSSNASSFVNAFVVPASNGNINTKVFARLNSNNTVGAVNGNISITGSQINSKNVPVTGTLTAKPLPTLTVDKTSLTGFTTTTNKASLAQSYKLQATNLDPGVTATVKAPAGYELSLTNAVNSIFTSQLTVIQAAGTINATVFVRLKSQSIAGNIAGTIQNLVAGLSKNITLIGTVALPPTLSVNPTSIPGFLTVKNQASAVKTYTVTALNLAAGATATVTAPANYEIRIQGTATFVSTLTLTQTSTGRIDRIIEARLKATTITGTVNGNIQHTIAGLIRNVNVLGTVAAPNLSTSLTSLTFTTVKNQASATKSYKVTATNLAAGNTALVTASAAYEISTSNNGVFTNSLTLSQNVTNGVNTDVFVRLKATATIGTITGSIQHTAAGIIRSVSLSTVVAAPTLSVIPISLNGFTAALNQPSVAKSYSLVASNLANGIVATVAAPAGYEISVQGTTIFSANLTLAQTTTGGISRVILVRLKAQTSIGAKTGNITNSVAGLTKTVAVNGTVTAPFSLAAGISAPLENPMESSFEGKELFVNAFPNPVTDLLTVEISAQDNHPVQLRLLNMQGAVLLGQEVKPVKGIQQIKLSFGNRVRGSYLLEVVSGTKHKTVQIIKL